MPLLGNIALGKYVAGDSPLHRLDPRTKLVAVTVMMTVALLSPGAGAGLCLRPLRPLRRGACPACRRGCWPGNLRSFLWLLAITALLHAFNTPGEPVWRVPWLDLQTTRQGLESAALFTVRLATVVTAAALLTLTTSPLELTDGLERLLRPLRRLRVPSHELAMTVSIALRFIPVLADEAERLQKAQMSRGAEFGGGPVRRARKLVPLLVPLFLSAFARADRLAVAMEARGYRGEGRTCYRELRLGRLDAAAGLLSAAAAAVILWAGRP